MAKSDAKPSSKSQILAGLADATGLSKKQVQGVLDALGGLIKKDLGKKGPGVFTIPGLVKLRRVHKPASPARKGINPFTKEAIMIKAKPARNAVRANPIKALKDMV